MEQEPTDAPVAVLKRMQENEAVRRTVGQNRVPPKRNANSE